MLARAQEKNECDDAQERAEQNADCQNAGNSTDDGEVEARLIECEHASEHRDYGEHEYGQLNQDVLV